VLVLLASGVLLPPDLYACAAAFAAATRASKVLLSGLLSAPLLLLAGPDALLGGWGSATDTLGCPELLLPVLSEPLTALQLTTLLVPCMGCLVLLLTVTRL
jgi:hypothetical protein